MRRSDDSDTRPVCVDIRGPQEYDRYRDDAGMCLHVIEGFYDTLSGAAHIDSVLAAVRVGTVGGNTRIGSVRGSATITTVTGTAIIDCLCDSARVGHVIGSATVGTVRDTARIGSVGDSARVGVVEDWASIGWIGDASRVAAVHDSVRIGEVTGEAAIAHIDGSAGVGHITDAATIGLLGGTAHVDRVSGSARVDAAELSVVHADGGVVVAGSSVAVYAHGTGARIEGGHVIPVPARLPACPTTPAPRVVPGGSAPPARRSRGSVLDRQMDPGWAEALRPVADRIDAMESFLADEIAAGRHFRPAGGDVLRAFRQPFDAVRVMILGQDPYPSAGHAVGLSFSVGPSVSPVPGSLGNVFAEYARDLGLPVPATGDLSPWTAQGVLLLNTVLTVGENQPASHRGAGWETVTEQAIRALVARPLPLVAILWGRDARDLGALLHGVPQIRSAHPSGMSATSGFFGSRPFSRANALLRRHGAEPVHWTLP